MSLNYRQGGPAINVPIRATLLSSDNDRDSRPRFAEILLIFLIFQQAVSSHLNGSTRMWYLERVGSVHARGLRCGDDLRGDLRRPCETSSEIRRGATPWLSTPCLRCHTTLVPWSLTLMPGPWRFTMASIMRRISTIGTPRSRTIPTIRARRSRP